MKLPEENKYDWVIIHTYFNSQTITHKKTSSKTEVKELIDSYYQYRKTKTLYDDEENYSVQRVDMLDTYTAVRIN